MKYGSMDQNSQLATNNYVKERWTQSASLANSLVENIWKYLMLVNSGSAVALLSFMGAKGTFSPFPAAICVLYFLIFGVVLVGIGYAANYYRFVYLSKKWRDETVLFFNNQIDWDDLIRNDSKRTRYFLVADIIAWLCFGCFLIALCIAWKNIPIN